MTARGEHFVVTAAAAQITCPAGTAWLLDVHVPRPQPLRLPGTIDAQRQIAHGAGLVADEAVTGCQIAVGRNPEIAGARAAGVGPVRTAVNFAQRRHQVGESVRLSPGDAPLEF